MPVPIPKILQSTIVAIELDTIYTKATLVLTGTNLNNLLWALSGNGGTTWDSQVTPTYTASNTVATFIQHTFTVADTTGIKYKAAGINAIITKATLAYTT